MARLARLALAGQAHLVVQRGHSGQAVFADTMDRDAYLAALREAAATAQVAVHAYALLDAEVRLLVSPTRAAGLAQLMQALGRRYVSAYNRRHGRSGTLWDGRYRCAVLQSGATRLQALLWADSARTPLESSDTTTEAPPHTSAAHRSGGTATPWLTDPPEYWALGNTPFEREAQYRTLLLAGVSTLQAQALQQAAWGGWAVGSAAFVATVAEQAARPARPRPRGRPRRLAG